MPNLQKAIDTMINLVTDPAHGYDQVWRNGEKGDFDCSSSIVYSLKQAGFDTGGATYTGNMQSNLVAHGWTTLPGNTPVGSLKPGDILLNTVNHVVMYIGGGNVAAFRVNEKGTVSGGQPGDQTGKESMVQPYYFYPWDVVLRYPQAATGIVREPVITRAVTTMAYTRRAAQTNQSADIGSIPKGYSVILTGATSNGQKVSGSSYWFEVNGRGWLPMVALRATSSYSIRRKVSAPTLNIRSAPDGGSRVIGQLSLGTVFTAEEVKIGTPVYGEPIWLKTRGGWVSFYYTTGA